MYRKKMLLLVGWSVWVILENVKQVLKLSLLIVLNPGVFTDPSFKKMGVITVRNMVGI